VRRLWLWAALLVCWGVQMRERTGEREGAGYLSGAMASVASVAGCGAMGRHWPSWAVASSAGLCVRGAVGFWTGSGGRGCRDGRADCAVTSARAGARQWPRRLTGERAGAAALVGC
jgi:hypothetical protein